jgi:hypothetical protein
MNTELNNLRLIEQTMRAHPSEIEPLYWIMEDAFHTGEKDRAVACYMMLAYHAKYTSRILAENLHKRQLERLKEVSYELFTGQTTRTYQSVEIQYATQPKPLGFGSEAELRDYLANNVSVLCDALGERVVVYGTEIPTEYGKCDIVVENDHILFPIELKTVQSNHKVVSQITKYVYHFYRSLRYNLYKPVQGVIISNGFDAWSINELRKQGTWIYDAFPDEVQRIRLTRIR